MSTHKRESVRRFAITAIWSVQNSYVSLNNLEEAEAWKQFLRLPEGKLLRGTTVLAKR
jgi:hypothetical protein